MTAPGAAVAPPAWATLVRADNPSPMTLEGTNTWVLRAPGAPAGSVVDPGPLDERHLDAVAARGPVDRVLLTHRHPDHAEGAERFAAMVGADVLDRRDLDSDGAVLATGGLDVRVVHTPGHTSDSVCFAVAGDEPALLTGDTVLGRGTTVVAHPDGVLADYLASLRRIVGVGAVTVLPGHGPVLPDAGAAATAYLAHREQRLGQVRSALAAGDTTAEQVVRRVYADVDPELWWAAELSVRAQLDYLRGA